jgi:hypothetical protein
VLLQETKPWRERVWSGLLKAVPYGEWPKPNPSVDPVIDPMAGGVPVDTVGRTSPPATRLPNVSPKLKN